MYKHKETGKIYEERSYSNHNGKIAETFRTVRKPFEVIEIVTPWIYNTDAVSYDDNKEEYKRMCNMNDSVHKEDILKIFDEVDIEPKISFGEKPKYIEVVGQMNCPFCGSKMKFTGEVLLSYPAQYPHKCTNDECGYSLNVSRWHEGEVFYGESVEEVERLLHGSLEDYETLRSRKK